MRHPDYQRWRTGGERDGSGKLTTIAPAAPDAQDDSYSIFEDGQSGLDDPASVPEGVVFEVLDNDTDADGDTLSVTHVFGAMHGTVTIIDGDDPDDLPGDAVLYTPYADYAGMDSFTYCIDDGNGGTDFATVNVMIEAVADIPEVSIEAFATDEVNVIRLVVTAEQTDDDDSEFIDQLLSSGLPPGVTLTPSGTINPAGQPGSLTQEYILTLPPDQNTDFGLTFTAVAEEMSNGDTETGSATIDIVYEYNSTTTGVQFEAEDQSIWSSGDEFVFIDDRFIGIDTGNFDVGLDDGPFVAGISGNVQLGFQSTLQFEGGSIDATADYDVTVETSYNQTVDELLIETGAFLTDTFFTTEGPMGSYVLDFIYDVMLSAYAGVNIDLGGINLDPAGVIPGDQTIDFGSINETINVGPVGVGPGSINILDLTSNDLGGTFTLPAPADSLSVDFAWPNLTTTSDPAILNPAESSGASNNFLQLNLDLDELATTLAGLPVNPFNPSLEAGPFFADFDLLNVFVNAGLNFLQDFSMAMGDLVGILSFEDGSSTAFTMGDSLQLSNASLIDQNGDNDGDVEFVFNMIPEAELSNLTELGFNVGGGVDILSVDVGYDLTINNPFSAVVGPDEFGFSDSFGFGPLAGFELSFPVAEVEVFNDTFDLAFGDEQILAVA
ncbi:Ig-like domain-containing protein [Sulfitobacter aestuariivivens]|uniref:Ig-like domain-containing protein n=1 Tax=Sulfitobacter aestuariivivens TaxID=2766981 RepID=UPI00360BF477